MKKLALNPFAVILICTAFGATLAAQSNPPTQKATPQTQEKIYEAGKDGVSEPSCLYCPRPDYSDELRRRKVQGDVTLSVVVRPDGTATEIKVVKSPSASLDKVSVDTLKKWKFKPALGPDGQPVAARVDVQVKFQVF